MTLGSFATGALTDLSPADLERMLDLDETLFVEHKSSLGRDSSFAVAKATAAFANTIGGWLLLGVKDGRPLAEPQSWATGAAPPLVDLLRERLRLELDPLPPFEARVMQVGEDEGKVGVVRIYESADAPHVSIRSGAVFVREVAGDADIAGPSKPGSGSKAQRKYEAVQIRSREQLLDLARRGERASARVAGLLDPSRPLPLISDRLELKFEATASGLAPLLLKGAALSARLAPYTTPARFRGWSTTADAMAAGLEAAEQLSRRIGLANNWTIPHPAGLSIDVPIDAGLINRDGAGNGLGARARVVIDGAGLAAAAIHLGAPDNEKRRRWVSLEEVERDWLLPLLRACVSILETGEFLGRARCQIDVVGLARVAMIQGHGPGGSEHHAEQLDYWVPVATDITIPTTDEELEAAARLAANAIGRSAALHTWDPGPSVHG